MSCIHKVLLQFPNDHQSIMMWAACCTAFFGFLRCSEFTTTSPNEFDPAAHLDIAVDNRNSPSLIRVTIKQSKTDPFRKGIHIFLGRTGKAICPVTAILPYLAICGNIEGPLFTTETGRPLTRQCFGSTLTRILKTAGLQADQYNTHSFRIGATTSAKQAGISDLHISTCWAGGRVMHMKHILEPPDHSWQTFQNNLWHRCRLSNYYSYL